MAKKKDLINEAKRKLYDRPLLRGFLHDFFAFIVTALSALVFAVGFKCFIAPPALIEAGEIRMVTGGMSGISQLVISTIDLFSGHAIHNAGVYDLVYSILYFVLNIPILVLAFFIGKRFFAFSLLNVGLTSLFMNLLGPLDANLFADIATFVNANGGMLSRAIFAGVCTGLSSGLAYKIDGSAGGIDVISYFIAIKKSVLVGRYSLIINAVTMTLYTLVNMADCGFGSNQATHVFVAMIFSVIYLIIVMSVTNLIHLRDKKVKIEIVSAVPELGRIITANIPHGATAFKGTGVFSGQEKTVIEIVVSSYELNKTVKIIKEADPSAFIQVSELRQVYGRFFIPPIH